MTRVTLVCSLGRNTCRLQIQHQQSIELRHDLLVAENCSADRARRTRRDACAATLTQRRVDFGVRTLSVFRLDETDRVEWTLIVADATT